MSAREGESDSRRAGHDALPLRPRLAGHVLPRRHRAGAAELVILHDTRAGRLVQVGLREWGLLAEADGTRDLEGIVLAAAREGSFARAGALRAFLEQLHAAGMLEDGVAREGEADEAGASQPVVPADRPLDPLAGYALRCDGSGSCCRLYASVLFSPVEVARARSLLPSVLDAGMRAANAFFPERGSGPSAGSAVALVDSRCAYLADSGLCSLHAAGGEGGKPLGCSLFPATFTDDGEAVRVSVAVECACVLASGAGDAGSEGRGSPLVPEGAAVRGDLDAGVFVAVLPEQVRLARGRYAPRRELVAWSRAALEAAAGASSAGLDWLAVFWSLAAALEASGLDVDAARPALSQAARGPSVDEVLPWLEALRRRAARRVHEDAAWRGERDLARRAARWIEKSAAILLDRDTCEGALRGREDGPSSARSTPIDLEAQRASEAFYARALLHGHQLVDPSDHALPLVLALRDRSIRMLVARAMPEAIARVAREEPGVPPDSAERYPLALVEAMLRGHGLDLYRSDIDAA